MSERADQPALKRYASYGVDPRLYATVKTKELDALESSVAALRAQDTWAELVAAKELLSRERREHEALEAEIATLRDIADQRLTNLVQSGDEVYALKREIEALRVKALKADAGYWLLKAAMFSSLNDVDEWPNAVIKWLADYEAAQLEAVSNDG